MKCQKQLSGLLSLLLLLSFVFSFVGSYTAYADTLTGSSYEITVSRKSSPPNITSNSSNNLPLSLTANNIDNASLGNIDFTFYFNYDFNKGDKVTITVFLYPNQRYTGFTDSGSKVQRADNDSVIINLSPVSFSRSNGEMVMEGTVLKDFNGYCHFDLSLKDPKYVSGVDMQQTVYIRFDSVEIAVEDNQTGLLNTILQWLQDIWDKLSNGFSNIVSSLSDGFSNLVNKIQSFITDVGDWFTDLGDRLSTWFSNIGDWFSNLWVNISTFFTEKWEDFERLWTISEQFKADIRIAWDGFIDSRFGGLIDAANGIDDLKTLLGEVFTFEQAQDFQIVVPRLDVYAFDAPVNFNMLQGGTYWFLADILDYNSGSDFTGAFSVMLDYYNIAVGAIVSLAVLYRLYKLYEKVIGVNTMEGHI